jgi:glucosamine--fructose-6-phosphate aminotransferase (isomerizing)
MSMLSEIREQPNVIRRVLSENQTAASEAFSLMADTTHGLIAARGTSDNAGRYAQYVWGALNNYTVGLTTPSLFSVYDDPPRLVDALVVGISQSGQSPDVVSVLEEARRQHQPTIAITNDPVSPMAKAGDVLLELRAGEEKAVAATKTYISELANIALVSTGGDTRELEQLPGSVASVIELEPEIEAHASRFTDLEQCAVIARGYNHATAFEWALKLQELTYAVAQPFSTADFLHGPIAVLEPGYPVLAIASAGPTLDDVRDVVVRSVDAGAQVMIITDDETTAGLSESSIVIPTGGIPEWLSPIPFVAACQLFAYHLTLAKGLEVETPRGLKKVTRTL